MTDANNPIRIIIADDHEISRIGIRRLVSSAPDVEVVAEAVNGAQTIDLARSLKPNLILLDMIMPQVTGIEAAQRIKTDIPSINIIMLSSADDSISIERAMYAGADGYLSKEVSSTELINAIRTVLLGERVFSKTVLNLLEGKATEVKIDEPPVSLTRREEEIVALVAKGLTSIDIGKKLFISPRTVETHRARIMDKLGVNNAAGLVRFALLHATYFNLHGTTDEA